MLCRTPIVASFARPGRAWARVLVMLAFALALLGGGRRYVVCRVLERSMPSCCCHGRVLAHAHYRALSGTEGQPSIQSPCCDAAETEVLPPTTQPATEQLAACDLMPAAVVAWRPPLAPPLAVSHRGGDPVARPGLSRAPPARRHKLRARLGVMHC